MIDRSSKIYLDRLGYYTVGNIRITDATQALLMGTIQDKDPIWHYCEDVFGSIDWTKHIDMSLDSLYLVRLQQLRDNYDHLVLYFSGGADSINILLTAINNNIHIDDIVMYYPFPLKNKFNNTDTSGENNFSEIEFAAKPILEKYKNQLANTTIRHLDIATANYKLLSYDNWIEQAPAHSMTVSNRTAAIATDPRLQDLAMAGKHVGLIFGIDKPRIVCDDTGYYFSFMDLTLHPFGTPYHYNAKQLLREFVHYEPFYWTPFLPEIVVKQAQVIVACMQTDPMLNQLIRAVTPDRHVIRMREELITKYIYSNPEKIWQTDKPTGTLVRTIDSWFWDYAPDKLKNNYKDAVAYMGRNCKPKYFVNNDILQGKKPHFSGKYLIKKVEGN
jgi:hypothetical protein